MQTVSKEIKISGVGFHSGKPVTMIIKPSKKPGIFFKRIDLPGTDLIPATYDNVDATHLRNTTVGNLKGAHVRTIEHLMAALYVFGVDNAIIEIDGPETLILDGSAKKFCELFEETRDKRKETRKKIIIKKEIIARKSEVLKTLPWMLRFKLGLYNLTHKKLTAGGKNDEFVRLYPYAKGLKINARIIYPMSVIGDQSYEFLLDDSAKAREKFIKEIAPARTFGSLAEWEYLKKRGMAHGANLENVIALNKAGDGTLNPLYFPDEFVRHKVIDILGDMYTAGGFIIGGIESYKGSHALNNLALRKLFADPDNYDIIEEQ